MSHIKKVIGVVSGKGGVGKSFVSAMTAVILQRRGYKVAILDADITGPSIPRLFGLQGQRAKQDSQGGYPVVSKTGIETMSVNYLLENETDPVVWRGPVISQTIKQFWQEIIWKDIDVMIVDMPPGTGDVPLTVFQTMPIDGILVVTSPQDTVNMVVSKAISMAGMMEIPILGIIENMSYVVCPDCGKRIDIFGASHVQQVADTYHVPLLAQGPLATDLAKNADIGLIELADATWLDAAADKIEQDILKK